MILLLFLFETILGSSIHAAIPADDPKTHIVKGKIFDETDPSKLLFTFERQPFPDGDKLKVVRSFKNPKGELVAFEEIHYENGKLVKLQMEQKQINEHGGFEIKGDKISFRFTKKNQVETDEETLDETLLIADTVAAYLHTNWDRLAKGEALKVRMPVPARQETFGFKFELDGEGVHEGKSVHIVKMYASSLVVRMMVKPLYFYIDKGEKKTVHKVVGRIVPKAERDGKWSDIDAVSVFTHEYK